MREVRHDLRLVWQVLLLLYSGTHAFVTPTSRPLQCASTTALWAALPPPMIISPIIKRMREEQEKKKQPLADAKEAAAEAPGLKVGKGVWKWPQVWPYDQSFFKPTIEADALEAKARMTTVSSMLTGVAQLNEEKKDDSGDIPKLDPFKYWGEEKANVETKLDAELEEKLKAHYGFYLRDGMSVLELGAAENSHLPDGLKLSRHVGVGASMPRMDANPSLTNKLLVDLNKVVEDRDVDSDEFRKLAQEPFDAIIMTNTAEYLTNPREVFRSCWYLLKPGGLMMVAFLGKDSTTDQFSEARTKVWRNYNDDQHIWITGSYFQFSAAEGWTSLYGFDISPDSSKEDGPLSALTNIGKKKSSMFVVQATKGYQDEHIDMENLERSIRSLCWMLPVMEERDKKLVVPRLVRIAEAAQDESIVEAMERNLANLPVIYESLTRMDQFAFTFTMQAQLAAELISDPDFNASEDQITALKEGLGLRTPNAEFWAPVGKDTAAMPIEDKISLLGHLVPRFGSGDPAQEEALQAFVSGLKPTYAVLRSKCPDWSEAEVQLMGTELLAAEVLIPGRSSRAEFATWLASLSATELRTWLRDRQAIRQVAKEEMAAYKEAREAERLRVEEYKRLMEEQIQTARMERSLVFNPRTQKMEVLDNPNKKKK